LALVELLSDPPVINYNHQLKQEGIIIIMRTLFTYLCLFYLLVPATQAHHSFATHYSYDEKVVIYGVITKLRLANPHSFFSVKVSLDDGSTEVWEVEANSIPLLARANITHGTFNIGERIKVTGMLSRDASRKLMFGLIGEKENGDEYYFIRPDWDKAAKAPTLIRGSKQSLNLKDMQDIWKRVIRDGEIMNTSGESPLPLNAKGLQAAAAYNPLESQYKDCLPPEMPSMLYLPYLIEIKVSANQFNMFHEYYAVDRQFSLDGKSAQTHELEQFGISSARIEGDALVIKTNNFPPMQAGLGSDFGPLGKGRNIPSSSNKVLTETYRLLNDKQILEATLVLEDKEYLSENFETTLLWERAPDGMEVIDFVCELDIAIKSTNNAVPD
jgi:hypothetical protein